MSEHNCEGMKEHVELEYYVVVEWFEHLLAQEVNDIVNNGGHCVGGVAICLSGSDTKYAQAVMRKVKHDV
jgi:hypothetical protein